MKAQYSKINLKMLNRKSVPANESQVVVNPQIFPYFFLYIFLNETGDLLYK